MPRFVLMTLCLFAVEEIPATAYAQDPGNKEEIRLDAPELKGDGSVDVRLRLQEILDKCDNNSKITIPAGRKYLLSGPVIIRKSLTFEMEPGALLISSWKPTQISEDGLLTVNSNDVVLENISINGGGYLHGGILIRDSNNVSVFGGKITDTGLSGLKIVSSRNCIVERVWIDRSHRTLVGDSGRDGAVTVSHKGWSGSNTPDSNNIVIKDVLVTNSYSKGINVGFTDGCRVENCTVNTTLDDSACGLYAGYGAKNVLFSECSVKLPRTNGIKISSGATDVTVSDCNITECQTTGIFIQGAINAAVSNCKVAVSGKNYGVKVAAHPDPRGSNTINAVISGNTITNTEAGASTGILVENHAGPFYTSRTIIKDNYISGFSDGVELFGGSTSADESRIINNRIEEFANVGVSVRWDARRAYIAENAIKSSESGQGCGIALDFKEATPGEKFTVKNNLVEVRRGTCVSARYADNVLMEGNKLFGRNGIDCGSGKKGMVCSGNYIEGPGSDIGVGINIGPSQRGCVLRGNRIKKFGVGIFSSSSSSIDDENNELTDCGKLKSIGG